jgi:hypothetical protein
MDDLGLQGKMVKSKGFNHSMLVLLSAAAISSGIGGSPAPGETADLTQSTAALLIETSSKFSEVKSKLLLHKDGYQKGHEQGMWVGRIVKDIEPFGQPSEPIHLTKRGSDFFDSIEVQPRGLAYVILKKPLKPLLKVIRITDAPLGQGLKEAQFIWEYVDLPSLVKRYVVRGGSGVGYFRPTDDGWRLDDLNINYLSEPAPQTAEERATEEREDREREALKRKREEEERVEKERLANLLRESKTPTRQVAQFDLGVGGHGVGRGVPFYNGRLCNAHQENVQFCCKGLRRRHSGRRHRANR